jgi:hypothetical protein
MTGSLHAPRFSNRLAVVRVEKGSAGSPSDRSLKLELVPPLLGHFSREAAARRLVWQK